MVHLYYGPGKGKTSAAMGQVVRAVGHGLSASVIQFMKGAEEMHDQYGEVKRFQDDPDVDVQQFPVGHMRPDEDLPPAARETLESALDTAAETVSTGAADVILLDEVLTLWDLDVADGDRLGELIRSTEESVELLLTGRDAPAEVVDESDYVTYFADVKHPFRQGLEPRAGIEF